MAKGISVALWAMLCWETLRPDIHVDVTLTFTTYLDFCRSHTVIHDGLTSFSRIMHPPTLQKLFRDSFGHTERHKVRCVALASKFPRSQSD